jgi:hypothetical protein
VVCLWVGYRILFVQGCIGQSYSVTWLCMVTGAKKQPLAQNWALNHRAHWYRRDQNSPVANSTHAGVTVCNLILRVLLC